MIGKVVEIKNNQIIIENINYEKQGFTLENNSSDALNVNVDDIVAYTIMNYCSGNLILCEFLHEDTKISFMPNKEFKEEPFILGIEYATTLYKKALKEELKGYLFEENKKEGFLLMLKEITGINFFNLIIKDEEDFFKINWFDESIKETQIPCSMHLYEYIYMQTKLSKTALIGLDSTLTFDNFKIPFKGLREACEKLISGYNRKGYINLYNLVIVKPRFFSRWFLKNKLYIYFHDKKQWNLFELER